MKGSSFTGVSFVNKINRSKRETWVIIYAISAERTRREARRDTNSIILHSLIDLLSHFALQTGANGTHRAKMLAHASAKDDCEDDDDEEKEVK